LPLLEWITVRLDVSENQWRRHNKGMEPQRTGRVPPLHTRRRNRTLGLRKTTRRIVRARSNDWAECRAKKGSAPSRRRDMSLDIPFYRTSPVSVNQDLGGSLSIAWSTKKGCSLVLQTFDRFARSEPGSSTMVYSTTTHEAIATPDRIGIDSRSPFPEVRCAVCVLDLSASSP
jgi:hypothetical protein